MKVRNKVMTSFGLILFSGLLALNSTSADRVDETKPTPYQDLTNLPTIKDSDFTVNLAEENELSDFILDFKIQSYEKKVSIQKNKEIERKIKKKKTKITKEIKDLKTEVKRAREENRRLAREVAEVGGSSTEAIPSTTSGITPGGVLQGGSWDGSKLTASMGVIFGPSGKETWYSEKVLPGGGLAIPGRHADSSGLIRDSDGYIVVATPHGEKGNLVRTSWGMAKVYDVNAGGNAIDLYTNWG